MGVRMGRGRRSLLDDLAVLPWPAGLVFGVLGFGLIRHGIPAWASGQPPLLAQAFGNPDAFAPLAWIVLVACSIASLVSWLNARRKRRLLDAQSGLASIAALGWRDFERLVGEAFRRQGYAVEESGLGGADGGIDLILSKDGQRTLVQCKQWRRRKVPVNVVREMYGLLAHHGAHAVQIATVGGFTPDAKRFAQGKPITLIDGDTLLAMMRAVQARDAVSRSRIEPVMQAAKPEVPSAPECPRCGGRMVERRNRRSGNRFWGCSTYPDCKGTR